MSSAIQNLIISIFYKYWTLSEKNFEMRRQTQRESMFIEILLIDFSRVLKAGAELYSEFHTGYSIRFLNENQYIDREIVV